MRSEITLYKRLFITLILALGVSTLVYAQTPTDSIATSDTKLNSQDSLLTTETTTHQRLKNITKKVKHTGSIFYRFLKSFDDYDTTYISPNYYNYTAMLQNTNYFQTYRFQGKGEEGEKSQTISTKPEPNIKVGPYFGWRWLFLGYTFDISHPKALGKSSEFNLSLYSSMLGCDLVYIRNNGNYRLRKAIGFDGIQPTSIRNTPFSGIKANMFSFSAYYVFNHRHFSYPAAYNQSTVQRKSCGSVMFGGGYSKQNINFDYKQLPTLLIGENGEKLNETLKFSAINYRYFYLSIGYAYNWVFARDWLLGASVMPSIGARKMKGEKINGNGVLMDILNLSTDCTSRLGVVWNNTHWFAGTSFISHLYLYRKKTLSLTNSVNYANIYVGFFFHRKKIYR